MNKLLLLLLVLLCFACTPSNKTFKPKPPLTSTEEVIERVRNQESPVYISKDYPAWSSFLFIFLLIISVCFLSSRHQYIRKTWHKLRSKIDKED